MTMMMRVSFSSMTLCTGRATAMARGQCISPTKRSFFASSTDYTRLMKESEIHCLPQENNSKLFVLAAGGMDLDMVQKVPQLHLARIYLSDQKIIYGAKVVNKTLGSIPQVCGRLLDTALENGGIEAHSTLHGLSEWVLKNEVDDTVITEICNGNMEHYDAAKWEKLALDFAHAGLGDEANLYLQKDGAKLIRIEHEADTTEFSDTSGGAMAIISFSS